MDKYQLNHPYHLFNRGVKKTPIIFEEKNYSYLINLLRRYQKKCKVKVCAYVLMPNHYHLLMSQSEPGETTLFLKGVFQSYSQALIRSYDHSGHIFESSPKSVRIKESTQCAYLCSYIHLNPVMANIVDKSEDWPYSNYKDFIGEGDGELYDPELADQLFKNAETYKKFVDDMFELRNSKLSNKYRFE